MQVFRRLRIWWTDARFPGEPKTAGEPSRGTQWMLLLALLTTTCVLFFARLDHPLLEPEEGRYAEIPRQMLAEGHFVTPTLHGEDYWQKPPLLYWLVMLSYQVFGVHDWSARLVPCLAGIATVLIATGWARRMLSFWTALLSGAILTLSMRFLYLAGMLTMDGLLCAFVLGGLAAGHLAITEAKPRLGWLLLSALACGLGVLTKGPVAIVLIAMPLIALCTLDRRARMLSWLESAVYLGVVTLIALPWFVVMARSAPEAAGTFLWLHNVMRYVAPIDHEKPAWFYLPSLLFGMLPWSLLLFPALAYLWRTAKARRRPAALGMFVLAFAWCVLFFSLSGCKRPGYILPAFPLGAMILATFVTHGLPWPRWMQAIQTAPPRLARRWVLGLLAMTLAMGVTLSLAASAVNLCPWQASLGMCVIFGLIGLLLAVPSQHLAIRTSWAGCGAFVFLLLFVGQRAWLPAYHDRFGLRRHVELTAEYEQEEPMPIVTFPKRWDSISFYTKRDDVQSYGPAEIAKLADDLRIHGKAIIFVRRNGALQELQRALPKEMELQILNRQGDFVAVGLVQWRSNWIQASITSAAPRPD